jgi:Ni,Fe-hydrogenase III large subunit
MLARPVPNTGAADPAETRPAPDGSITLRTGPIAQPGPALLSLGARGETVTKLDYRLGYAHRGVLDRIRGRSPAEAAFLVARLSGEGTVAHSLAFARAIEAATGVEPPPRALAIRAVVLQLERIAIGLHDLAQTLEAAGRDPAPLRQRREDLLRACHVAFGHRLLMDLVVPGGIARDMSPEAAQAIAGPLETLKLPSLAAHPRLARIEPRLASLRAALEGLLTRPRTLPEGALIGAVPITVGEGLGQAEGPRGTHVHWVQVRDGRVAQAFARDPAFLLWPQFQREAVGIKLADLPVAAAAAGLSSAGADL